MTALAELSFTEYRLAVEGMARGGYMDERVRSTVHDTLAALFARRAGSLAGPRDRPRRPAREPCVGTGQSLWTHRIYDIPVADEAMLADAAHLAWRHLLPLMPEAELHRVVCGDMIFLPEKGSSVALHTPGQAPTALLHTIELQNAYWAGAAKLDRALLRRVAALAYDTRNCDFRELERRTDEVIDFYERARVFEMILHSLVGMLSPLQFSTWEAVAGAWDLQRQLDAVRDKVDALSSIHTALLADASQRRTARLNAGVFVFTVFALAQTLFAAITFGFTGIGAHLTTIHGIAIGITISVGRAVRGDRLHAAALGRGAPASCPGVRPRRAGRAPSPPRAEHPRGFGDLTRARAPTRTRTSRPAHEPLGPNRSVRIASAGWPASTSRSAARSTNGVGPQTKTAGDAAGPGPTAASIWASMRRSKPPQPGGCSRVSVRCNCTDSRCAAAASSSSR